MASRRGRDGARGRRGRGGRGRGVAGIMQCCRRVEVAMPMHLRSSALDRLSLLIIFWYMGIWKCTYCHFIYFGTSHLAISLSRDGYHVMPTNLVRIWFS